MYVLVGALHDHAAIRKPGSAGLEPLFHLLSVAWLLALHGDELHEDVEDWRAPLADTDDSSPRLATTCSTSRVSAVCIAATSELKWTAPLSPEAGLLDEWEALLADEFAGEAFLE